MHHFCLSIHNHDFKLDMKKHKCSEGKFSMFTTVKVVILARLNFGDSLVLDELVCFYFHGTEFTPIDLCTKETYWRVFILAFMRS